MATSAINALQITIITLRFAMTYFMGSGHRVAQAFLRTLHGRRLPATCWSWSALELLFYARGTGLASFSIGGPVTEPGRGRTANNLKCRGCRLPIRASLIVDLAKGSSIRWLMWWKRLAIVSSGSCPVR
jgi:hypothetical protein